MFLNLVLPLLALAIVLAYGIPQLVAHYQSPRSHYPLDFEYLVNGGRVITGDDPALLYKEPQNRVQFVATHGFSFPGGYGYAPLFAYLMSAFKSLDFFKAWDLWKIGVAVCSIIVAGATASGFGNWAWRSLVFAAAFTWLPLMLNASFGQSGAIGAAILAAGALLFLHDRVKGAALMSLTVFKPTLTIAPAIMVLGEKPRVFITFCVVGGLVALVPFIWLGPDGLVGWLGILSNRHVQEQARASRLNEGLVTFLGVEGTAARLALSLALLALVGFCHFVHQRLGVEAAGALAAAGSLVISPHALIYDWGIAMTAILLLRHGSAGFLSTDIGAGLMLALLLIAGDLAWYYADHFSAVRPLFYWGVAFSALLIGLAAVMKKSRPLGASALRAET